jgi:hypothetical protein
MSDYPRLDKFFEGFGLFLVIIIGFLTLLLAVVSAILIFVVLINLTPFFGYGALLILAAATVGGLLNVWKNR